MELRTLGSTEVRIPAIGQGTMGIGGYFAPDRRDDREVVRLLRLGIDWGMTLLDTAEVYGGGHSEELVGEAIGGIRDRVFVATKFSPENSTSEGVRGSAEQSLRRLGTDWIDLYQVHWPNPRVPVEETVRAMERLVAEGKVRYIGLSNFSLRETRSFLSCLSVARLVSVQEEYNLFNRTVEESLLPFCRSEGITLLAYSPLLQGRIAANGGDRRRQTLSVIASRYGISAGQLALCWILRDPRVAAIPKASSERHLRENATALDHGIDPLDLVTISELYAPDARRIPPDEIEVAADSNRNVYRTVEEATENRFQFTPSPTELAAQIASGEVVKPIKVRLRADGRGQGRYELIEGRIRYWAWVIAHDGKVPISALVDRSEAP